MDLLATVIWKRRRGCGGWVGGSGGGSCRSSNYMMG